MARTNVRGSQIYDGSVQRIDLDTTTAGQAVIAKVLAGTGISISQTGIDSGTGDVTVGLTVPVTIALGGTGQTNRQSAINSLSDVSSATNENVLTKDTATGNAVFKSVPYPVTSVFGRTGAVIAQSGDYTNAMVGLGNVTNDAQLKRAANDFNSFTQKNPPVAGDILLIEDSAASGAKKYVTFGTIPHSILNGIGTNTHAQIDSHISSTSNPHSVTKTQVGLGNVTDDAQLKRAAGDFASFAIKNTPVNADLLLIEDSAASNGKKYITLGTLPYPVISVFGRTGAVVAQSGDYNNSQVGLGNVTNDAQLKRAANDFNTFTAKTTLVGGDIFLIEDSAASGAKKYSTLTDIGNTALFNANRLQGFNIHTATPSDGSVLYYDNTNSRWAASGVWTAWTPTLGSVGGTYTTTTVNYARYFQIGKRVNFTLDVTGTANSNPTALTFTLPINPVSGRTYGTGGHIVIGTSHYATAVTLDSVTGGTVYRGDNGSMGNNNVANYQISGFYEVA